MAKRASQGNRIEGVSVRRRSLPDLSAVSSSLVAIFSIFDQLEEEYLSSDERAKFGLLLRRKYRELVYLAARSRDDEMRGRLRRLLVTLGSISVRLVEREGVGGESVCRRLRGAIRCGEVVEWVSHFYFATHGIKEAQTTGNWESVELDCSSYERFSEERSRLLHWLQDSIER